MNTLASQVMVQIYEIRPRSMYHTFSLNRYTRSFGCSDSKFWMEAKSKHREWKRWTLSWTLKKYQLVFSSERAWRNKEHLDIDRHHDARNIERILIDDQCKWPGVICSSVTGLDSLGSNSEAAKRYSSLYLLNLKCHGHNQQVTRRRGGGSKYMQTIQWGRAFKAPL